MFRLLNYWLKVSVFEIEVVKSFQANDVKSNSRDSRGNLMITRLMGNSVYFVIRYFFREKSLKTSVESYLGVKDLQYRYGVIGIRPTAQSLAKDIALHSNCVDIFGFDGFEENSRLDFWNPTASAIIHNRSLSKGEIGCARSHQLAYESEREADWIILLEDDVVIVGDLTEIERKLADISLKPTVVLFENNDSDTLRLPFWKKRHGTYSYALNKSALSIIRDSYTQIWCTADWPIQWVFQTQFLVLGQNAVSLNVDVESLIEGGRKEEKMSSMSAKQSGMLPQSEIRQESLYLGKTSSMLRLYRFLRDNHVSRPLWTAFLASKSGLYSGGAG